MTKRMLLGVALTATLMCTAAVFAQEGGGQRPGGPGGRQMLTVDEQIARWSEQLTLTDDQKAKIKPILEDQRKDMAKLREDTSMSPEDRRAKNQEIRKAGNDKIRKILNADQQKKWDDMQQQMQQRGPGGPPKSGS